MRFQKWNDEIAAELSAERAGLAALLAEQAQAEAQCAALAAEHEQHVGALDRLHRGVSLSGALAGHYADLRNQWQAAVGNAARGRQQILNSERRIADLETALHQLDVLAPPVPPEMSGAEHAEAA